MASSQENKWKCIHCSSTFKYEGQLDRHLVTHDPNTKVKCKICGKISKNPATLSAHVSYMHTNRIQPACNICDKPFSNLAHLRRHIDTVHSKKERPRSHCEFPGCEKTYLDKDAMSKHVKTEHAENAARFPCSLCGKEFKSRGDLGHHISTHTTEKPFKCTTCWRSFALRKGLKTHENCQLSQRQVPTAKIMNFGPARVQVHSSGTATWLRFATERHSREHLRTTFIIRGSLQRHIRIVHGNQRNYRCSFCDKSFASASGLKRHVEARHTDKKVKIYACDNCEYKSHSKGNLAQHARRHNVSNRMDCYFCGERFVYFQALARHCSRIHTLEK
ncbi:Zinc finger protein 26 [Folsomia candida]|uniref:Zinc finger protein 26 n=1 Tax=Folsomia candida TaxID=158441 RepID=A0A226DL50_FOLCA|nr:Zinc finger protein 26 [Folsomia candida]